MAVAAVAVFETSVDAMDVGGIAGPFVAIGVCRGPPLAHTMHTDAE